MQTFVLGLRYFFIDLLGGIARWPVWWYTRGFLYVARRGMDWIALYARSLSLSVWMKNLFVPMYGMYDWQSRMISFLMRVFQIFFRAIGVFLLSLVVVGVILVYLILPPVCVFLFVNEWIELYA